MNINSVSTPAVNTMPVARNEAVKTAASLPAVTGDKVEIGSNNVAEGNNPFSKITPEKAKLIAAVAGTGISILAGAAIVGLSGGSLAVAAGLGAAFGGVAGAGVGAAFGGMTGLLLAHPGKGAKIGAIAFGTLGAISGAFKGMALTGLAGAMGGGSVAGAIAATLLSIL